MRKKKLSGRPERFATWMRSIWRRRWLSLTCAWTICVLGWAAVALWPSLYMSSAVVYADLGRLVDRGIVAAGNGAEAALDQRDGSALKAALLNDESLAELRNTTALDVRSIDELKQSIMIRATAPALFVASYDHHDPAIAHQVLDSVLSSFVKRLDSADTSQTVDFEQEITDLQARLEEAEADLASFNQANVDIFEDLDGRPARIGVLENEIIDLEARIERAIIERDEVALELAQLPSSQEEQDEPAPAPSLSASELSELAALQSRLAELRERYADSHPYVSTVLNAIETLESKIGNEAQDGAGDGSDEATPSGDRAIDEQVAELKKRHGEKIDRLSELNNELANKQREIDRLNALTASTSSVEAEQSKLVAARDELAAALTELTADPETAGEGAGSARAGQDGGTEQRAFKLINEPSLPDKPNGLPRLLSLALVLVGGVSIGSGMAVLRNRSKGVFESAWQLKQRFDVGVLGTISEVMSPSERKELSQAKIVFAAACLGLVGLFGGLAAAESMNLLAPWGDSLRNRLLG